MTICKAALLVKASYLGVIISRPQRLTDGRNVLDLGRYPRRQAYE
jgi:hypothetical protein